MNLSDQVKCVNIGMCIENQTIGFNPDDNVRKIDIQDKLDKLVETMHYCIDRIQREENSELLEIIKLYC